MPKNTLKELTTLVETRLSKLFYSSDEQKDQLLESMRYSLMAGGKRLRPILVLASCQAAGGKIVEACLDVACALECVHTYSLIHDDLPAMDDDDLRRGKPTNHVVYGEAMAVLAGDGLLTDAFLLIAQATQTSSMSAKLMKELAKGAGSNGMVAGQAQDILSEDTAVSVETMQWIHAHKTGALIVSACRMGGILANANEHHLQSLTEYAKNIGLAFQIIDDVLDVEGDSTLLGKATGRDECLKKSTYPSLFGLEKSKQLAHVACEKAKVALKDMPGDTQLLAYLADYIVSRKK